MTDDSARRIAALVAELNDHNYSYHVLAQPTIADQEYDALLSELARQEEKHPDLRLPDSPTLRVGGQPTSEFPSTLHSPPMLSLDNSYSRDDLAAFDQRVRDNLPDETFTYVCELKIDGVALSIRYENSVLAGGGHARQRDGRGRDHRQCPYHSVYSPAAASGWHQLRGSGRGVYGVGRIRPAEQGARVREVSHRSRIHEMPRRAR